VRVSGREEIDEFRVRDDDSGTIVFCNPLCDVGSKVCASMSVLIDT